MGPSTQNLRSQNTNGGKEGKTIDLTDDAAAPPTSALQASATAAPLTRPDARNRRRGARPLQRSLLRASSKMLSTAPPQAG